MADRYWVGGTANWDGTAGTKWATTSGGAGGASVPTTADAVFFTNLSTGTCTISSGNTGAASINCTGFTGTIAGSSAITVAGSVTLVAGMTYTYSGTMTITGTGTLTSGGKTHGPVTITGSGITVTLGDNFSSSGSLTVNEGTFSTSASNYSITATNLVSNSGSVRSVLLNGSTVTLSSTSTVPGITSPQNLTFNAGTSTLIFSGATTAIASANYYNISLTSTTARSVTISNTANAPATMNRLVVTAPSTAGWTEILFDGPLTIADGIATTGTAGNRRVLFRSFAIALSQSLTVNGTGAGTLTDADFRDLFISGTATPLSGTRIGDLGGNTGVTFSAPKTVYWNLAGAQNWTADAWATTSTGTPSTDNFPLAQDTATFTDAGSVTGTITLNSAAIVLPTVDMSGRTSAMTMALGADLRVYGDWKNGAGTTLSGAFSLTFIGTRKQTITSAGKSFPGSILIQNWVGGVELADALTSTGSVIVQIGSFDTKNYSLTASALISQAGNALYATAPRTLNLGSSTVNLSGTTALTLDSAGGISVFNAGTSQINLTGSTTGISPVTVSSTSGGLTLYNVSCTSASLSSASLPGGFTINNFTLTPPASGIVSLAVSGDCTISGTLTISGGSPSIRTFISSTTLDTARTITVNNLIATDCDFRDITIAGAAAGSSPVRAGDRGNNSGISFPAPKTVYWNLAGTANWSNVGWAATSGGTPAAANFPLAQDTAVFDNAGAAGTVSVNFDYALGTFDASARTSAMTLAGGGSLNMFGDWKFGTGVTDGGGFVIFAKRGVTQTITCNGVQFNRQVQINNSTGTVQLADNFVSSSTLALVSGTFNAGTRNVTASVVEITGTSNRTLRMGSGTWTVTGTGTIWDATNVSNMAVLKETANIVLSSAVGGSRTFIGGNQTYNKLTLSGSPTNTTINGSNTFSELASTITVAHTINFGAAQTFGKWTVTGTLGNVVTIGGAGTNHVLVGACTSGIDYLSMGSVAFSQSSMAEFYAGANSTGTAGVPVYRTAKPADATRYWVGGTGNWNSTTKWSATSGGASGASVPRSHDDVIFNSASSASDYTASVVGESSPNFARCKSLTVAGPATGNLTFAGGDPLVIHNNTSFAATGITRTYSGAIYLSGSTTGRTFTSNGVSFNSIFYINGADCGWSLGSALNIGSNSVFHQWGSFSLGTYSLTASTLSSSANTTRTLDLGSSTVSLTGTSTVVYFGPTTPDSSAVMARESLTFNAGTSQINCTYSGTVTTTFFGNNKTFYNVAFTNPDTGRVEINHVNTFNNLSFSGMTSSGLKTVLVAGNQTVNGTLTFSAGTNASMRRLLSSSSSVANTVRTLTCAAFSGTDVDFKDITIAGAAAPVSGTRLGNAKNNSGITFTAAANKYWNLAVGGNWSDTAWATSSGGAPAANNFPLPQDTCIFEATGLNSGATVTLNSNYVLGSLDMSARTSNTMTLSIPLTSTNPVLVLGNWTNGTGVTISGTSPTLTFAGLGAQTITSAGVPFNTNGMVDIVSPGGTVTLQDAFSTNGSFYVTLGTFNAVTYNVTVSGTAAGSTVSGLRTIAMGTGTWTLSNSGTCWSVSNAALLTITGSATISLTSASSKTFAGGGVSYDNVTLNQGGAGALTVSGTLNQFYDITNSYKTVGETRIIFSALVQKVQRFTAAGEAGRLLILSGTTGSNPGNLLLTGPTKPNSDYLRIVDMIATPVTNSWYAGPNSTNAGSLGWSFTSAPASSTFFLFF